MAAGEVGEQAAGLDEGGGVAASAGLVAEGLGDHRLADADGSVEDDGLAGLDEAQDGEVTDGGGGDVRVVGEVELLERGGVFEAGLADPAGERGGVAPGDLVLAEHLEELEVAELTGGGLGEAGFEGVEHPGQLQGAQRRLQLVAAGHRRPPRRDRRRKPGAVWPGERRSRPGRG